MTKLYLTPLEKYHLERKESQKARYLKDRAKIEAGEDANIKDHEKTIKEKEKAVVEYWKEKGVEHKKAVKEESDTKQKAAYDAEMKELERLRRPAYVDKREPTGKEAGQTTLMRQKETKILSDSMIKRENEKTEEWRQSERENG